MKLVQINTVCNTSIGHIMAGIQRAADNNGIYTVSIYGRRHGYSDLRCLKIGNGLSFWLHVALTTVTDFHGLGSVIVTSRIIHFLKKEQPDIIQLHNIHGYYINYPMLFDYLKNEYKGRMYWMLHDCWAFTGHCAYYTAAGCDRWKSLCHDCPEKREYPISLLLDSSSCNYRRKKKYFTGLKNMTIIVPSHWLESQVKESFLKDYPVEVVNNGIDLSIYRPQRDSGIRARYGIPQNKKIILGVAMYWTKRKGLSDFKRLSQRLIEQGNNEYVIVLVGLSSKQKANLPDNVIGIRRTENVRDIVALYTESHIMVNPSVEETFSMVTVEAMACGTPVIVLDTSAVCELVSGDTGIVLHKDRSQEVNPDRYIEAIHSIETKMSEGIISEQSLVRHASGYSSERQTDHILSLYKRLG